MLKSEVQNMTITNIIDLMYSDTMYSLENQLVGVNEIRIAGRDYNCLLYTSPSPRDRG